MLVSPKWQTMWLESQHCSKTIMNVPLPTQQAKKVLEDLRTNCCSPNKAVQLEALKCWGMWIKSQNPDDWKLNTVCFTAVRPLITKKMQPLHKDVDICKLKLSLMWALLLKVENIMQLEGPQYILEVFLQSCLSWLSSASGDGCENQISVLIFQLLLSILKRSETLSDCDKEMFAPLNSDILHSRKVFHRLADKFLNIFIHWRKVQDKRMFLKLWKSFLEHCELSCEHIPIPLWHKVFKLADQICSEKNEPVKERLAFLHSCATTLKSVLSSSKFIDFGNLLTTPCEALLKKLVELCTFKCTEFCDWEMFLHSKEISQMLSEKSVAIGGFDLCIRVLDVLEEFWLKELLWGVWCGLVYCYKVHLQHLNRNNFTEVEMKFYRKLRGVAVNFELDRDALHKDCISEVEKHIQVLNISCFCSSFQSKIPEGKDSGATEIPEPMEVDAEAPVVVPKGSPRPPTGTFSTVALYKRPTAPRATTDNISFDLVKNILKNVDTKSFFNCLWSFRFLNGGVQPTNGDSVSLSVQFKVDNNEGVRLTLSCVKPKVSSPVFGRENAVVPYLRLPQSENREEEVKEQKKREKEQREREENTEEQKKEEKEKREIEDTEEQKKEGTEGEDEEEDEDEDEDEVISTPRTRSRKRAEEEMKKEMENQKRKKRKSFEVLVQEIVRKNKERKTEKNSRRKSPVLLKRNKRKVEKEKGVTKSEEKEELPERKLRHPKKEEEGKTDKKGKKKSFKTDGKLENYFKVITKKSVGEVKKEEKTPRKGKKGKEGKKDSPCCEKEEGERKGEIGWRQTSLKTMMNRKNKTEKGKPEARGRERERERGKGGEPAARKVVKLTGSPLSKLSPFKEVFHDHEYAKIEPQQMESFERVILDKQERILDRETPKKAKQRVEPFERVRLDKQGRVLDQETPKKAKEQMETPERVRLDKREKLLDQETPKKAKVEPQKMKTFETMRLDKQEKVLDRETPKKAKQQLETLERMRLEQERTLDRETSKKAKIEPQKVETFERMPLDKQEKVLDQETPKKAKEQMETLQRTLLDKQENFLDQETSKKAKIESQKMENLERMLLDTQEKVLDRETPKRARQQMETFERVRLDRQEKVLDRETPREAEPVCEDVEMADAPKANEPVSNTESPKTEIKLPKDEKTELQEYQNAEIEDESEQWKPPEKPSGDEKPPPKVDTPNVQTVHFEKGQPKESDLPEKGETPSDVATPEETPEVGAECGGRRGRKRMRMLDSLKPSKKGRLEDDGEEEKLPPEVTEKENLEEKQRTISPTKKERSGSAVGRSEGSPKGGMISSRALRMIALVPESTKGSQVQREATPRAEVLKCKKAPNVDKNSRASKMLALLSENVPEPEETNEEKAEDNGRKVLTSTPNVKTPVSSLKSPKSIRKRRSIRFDDAKNETVLYQTDTPPSQILEEKEKCRRIKPAES